MVPDLWDIAILAILPLTRSIRRRRSLPDIKEERFDEVLCMLEHERERLDEDLKRLTLAAAYYLRDLLPERRNRRRRRRCSTWTR